MEELTYQLKSVNFDGPLGLLLHLIERDKIDIYDIPIAEIARQYMAYVEQMEEDDLDVVSEFLVMAATLLDIKARMLLPKEVDEETGEEIDPRAELVEQLLEYKRFQYMAQELAACEKEAERFFYKEESIPEEVRGYVPPIDLDELLGGVTAERLCRIFADVMRRMEEKADPVRGRFGVIRRERVPLGARIERILHYAKRHRRFSFREMLTAGGGGRTEVVVSFLAILELMKLGKIEAVQAEEGADIEIRATERIDEADALDFSALVDE